MRVSITSWGVSGCAEPATHFRRPANTPVQPAFLSRHDCMAVPSERWSDAVQGGLEGQALIGRLAFFYWPVVHKWRHEGCLIHRASQAVNGVDAASPKTALQGRPGDGDVWPPSFIGHLHRDS